MSPGGDSPGVTEIFHEGLRIPGIKRIYCGNLRRDVFDTLINMTRQPVMVGLDFECQIAANNGPSLYQRSICTAWSGNDQCSVLTDDRLFENYIRETSFGNPRWDLERERGD